MSYTVQLVYAIPGGYKPRQYYLGLTWTDSTDPNAASVNVYRSTVSGGPYTLIANVGMGVQSYSDFNVVVGTTYFYVVTEVNNVGAESTFSTEQSGTPGWIP
jgi:fibronectin type 3 domain-containing protein